MYNTLLQVASSNDDLEILGLIRADVEKWLGEWKISSEEKCVFLKSIVDAYAAAGEPWVDISLDFSPKLTKYQG